MIFETVRATPSVQWARSEHNDAQRLSIDDITPGVPGYPDEEDLAIQMEARRRVCQLFVEAITEAAPIWIWGDGYGGAVRCLFDDIAREIGMPFRSDGPVLAVAPDPPRRKVLSANLRGQVYARDGLVCVSCGSTTDLTVDHRIPVSKGGTDEFDNLQTMCRPCNIRKGAR